MQNPYPFNENPYPFNENPYPFNVNRYPFNGNPYPFNEDPYPKNASALSVAPKRTKCVHKSCWEAQYYDEDVLHTRHTTSPKRE